MTVALAQIACDDKKLSKARERFERSTIALNLRITESSTMTSAPDTASIYATLTEILRDTFDNDDLVASPTLTAAQVEGWDSMGNVRLFLSIEQEFGVRFNASEIGGIKNVGELVALLQHKTSS
jgi:acyl carrier protein